MISSIEIQHLRGITQGLLKGLAPLTVFTGPNGCGKSTVLDALWIAASPAPGEAVGRVVRRRPETRDGARWLVSASAPKRTATLTITDTSNAAQTSLVQMAGSGNMPTIVEGGIRAERPLPSRTARSRAAEVP